MQIGTTTLRPGTLSEPAVTELATRPARALQVGWLLMQSSALVLAVVATPLLHAHLQTITPDQLGNISMAQPNAASAAALGRSGVPLSTYAGVMVAVEWLYLLLCVLLGAVIMGKRSRDPVGLAFAFIAVPLGSTIFLRMLHAGYPELQLPFLFYELGLTVATVLFFGLFPDGRWVPHWMRWVTSVLIGTVVLATLLSTVTSNLSSLDDLNFLVGLAVWPIILGAQVYRYRRRATLVQRQQSKWLIFGIAMFVLNVVVGVTFLLSGLAARYQWINFLLCYGASFAMIVAFGFAVLRYRLFDVDLVINRTLVYSSLTLCLVGLYALIVGVLGALFQAQGGALSAFIAAAAIAVSFHPLHQRLQRAIDRLLYGERSDPYRVIARLGQRLEATFASSEILPTLVQTVSESLNLPYVAIALAEQERPDVILMDIRIPGGDGINATRRILRVLPQVRVLVVTMFEDDASVFAAMRAGARGYILKEATNDEILQAIRTIGNGGAMFSPAIATRLLAFFAHPHVTIPRTIFPELTDREREILDLLARGRGTTEIADRLSLSGKTISNYISNILTKLQVTDRAEAIVRARDAGLGKT